MRRKGLGSPFQVRDAGESIEPNSIETHTCLPLTCVSYNLQWAQMQTRPRQLEYFELSAGIYPFRDWLLSLKDVSTRHRLEIRLRKLELGNPGHWRALGDGVIELKEDFGPGFRLYVAEDGGVLVILRAGGPLCQTE